MILDPYNSLLEISPGQLGQRGCNDLKEFLMNMDIEQAKKLAGGVLSAVGVTFSQQDYDDYKQEILLLILRELKKDSALSLVNNPMLFKLLKWRLLDMLRKDNRNNQRCEPSDDLPAVSYTNWDQIELQTVFDSYLKDMDKADVTYQLLSMYLSNPRPSIERIL